MDLTLVQPLVRLEHVDSTAAFKEWIRDDLRRLLPHASLLVTLGKLYSVGSVATHRIDVNFPLSIIEELKNGAGALDDPMMYGWFRSERARYINLVAVDEIGAQQRWRNVMLSYGMRGMLIHGVMDHAARRFAVFQLGNPFAGDLPATSRLLASLTPHMARSAWALIDSRIVSTRRLVSHPTLSLTPTELNIIELLAQGLSNKEIARRRGVSDSTIKTQVQRTGTKVGATRRAEIVAIAMPMLCPLPAQTLIDYDEL